MKLLKINNLVTILIIVLFYSCSNNTDQLSRYKNKITSQLIIETQKESKLISTALDIYKLKNDIIYAPDAVKKINHLIQFKDSLNVMILNLDSITTNKINQIKNALLYNFTTYKKGKHKWSIDTIQYSLNNCNPIDTILISKSLIQFDLLNEKSNLNHYLTKMRILQLSQAIFKRWSEKFDISVFSCFGPVPETILKTDNHIFYQDENSYIFPNLFATANDEPIHLLKENSTEFIMKNGKKKVFSNPISLKASATKGVHTVNGVIMITQKGELVPKPFEFRYIVE